MLLLRRLAVVSRRIGVSPVPLSMLRPVGLSYSTTTASSKRPMSTNTPINHHVNVEQESKQLLLKELNKEIEEQSLVLKEDLSSLSTILSEHKDYLKGSGFEVIDPSANCTRVGLRKSIDGTVMTVFFDVAQVIQRGGNASNEFEDEDNEDDYESSSMENIELDIELCKEGKKLQLSCELDLGFEVDEDGEEAVSGKEQSRNQSEDDLIPGDSHLYITDARMTCDADSSGSEHVYMGPEFTTLDDNLQSSLTEFVQSKLGDLHALGAFIDDYSGTKEGSQYNQWLNDVRTIIS